LVTAVVAMPSSGATRDEHGKKAPARQALTGADGHEFRRPLCLRPRVASGSQTKVRIVGGVK
jgi:hypothetical protein